MKKKINIAIIGAGNGGQAFAGHLASMGHRVRLFDRDQSKVSAINKTKKIKLVGALELEGRIDFASTEMKEVIDEASLILVSTTANAHGKVALQMAPYLKDEQIIVLNPGRTCGALEFKNVLNEAGIKSHVYVAEAQTLIYACRLMGNGKVNIIGVKDRVLLSAYPASETQYVINFLNNLFTCFFPASNILQTSFENIGAMFHPIVVLFNAATIERGQKFYFYRDMTDGLARLIEAADKERLNVANAYGITPIPAFEWVSYAYDGVKGDTLCERMQNNPAYYEILAPMTINCRQITEDIPMGIVPIAQLGKAANVNTPILDSLITMCSTLLNKNFYNEGRTLKRLGLDGLNKDEIIKKIQ